MRSASLLSHDFGLLWNVNLAEGFTFERHESISNSYGRKYPRLEDMWAKFITSYLNKEYFLNLTAIFGTVSSFIWKINMQRLYRTEMFWKINRRICSPIKIPKVSSFEPNRLEHFRTQLQAIDFLHKVSLPKLLIGWKKADPWSFFSN